MQFERTECLEWCFGNLIENAVRGKVAEFVVAKALALIGEPKVEWDSVDLRFQGKTIEVKSSAYLQSWVQNKPSQIRFDIAQRKQIWNYETNESFDLDLPRRVADIYVFCVFLEINEELANPLDTGQWNFFVIPTSTLDDKFGPQKSIGLRPIERVAQPIKYEELKARIDLL